MKFVFTGDPRPERPEWSASNPKTIRVETRNQNTYAFELNGDAVEVKKEDEAFFSGNSHYTQENELTDRSEPQWSPETIKKAQGKPAAEFNTVKKSKKKSKKKK